MKIITLNGARNVRDLGDTYSKEGKRIRSGVLFRADALNALDDEDVQTLYDLDIRTIIDLRTAREVQQKPDRVIEDINYRNIRIFNEERSGVTREHHANLADHYRSMPSMTDVYREILTEEHAVKQMGTVLRMIMDEENEPVIFHCTAGKDRTGLIAMFLLDMLGVDEDTIREDYLMTNLTAVEDAHVFAERIYAESGDRELAERLETAFVAREEYLDTALKLMKDTCGSTERYMEEKLGITPEMREDFRKRMLEEA